MTSLEERIKIGKAIADLECMAINITGELATGESKVLEGYLEAINIAQEVLKARIKYRWHDLRKNPDDLPLRAISITGERTCHESDEVVAYNGCYFHIAYYNHDSGMWTETTEYRHINVIAWREIELFEE